MNMPKQASPATAISEFFRLVQTQDVGSERRRKRDTEIERDKALVLTPVRQLLKTLIDAGVVVHHRDSYNHAASKRPGPVPFQVYEDEASPTWLPGRSIMMDHPAEIEITVPNEYQIAQEGVIVIRCMTPDHPQESLLRGPFHTVGAACMALARFLALSTVRVARKPSEK